MQPRVVEPAGPPHSASAWPRIAVEPSVKNVEASSRRIRMISTATRLAAAPLWSTATRLMLVRLPYERGGDGGEPDAVSLTAPDERPATEGSGVSLRFC